MNSLNKLLNNKRSLRAAINSMSMEEAEACFLKLQEVLEDRRALEAERLAELEEKERVINELREKMTSFGLSVEDLGTAVNPRPHTTKGRKIEPKYEWLDEEGHIRQWSGRGNMPVGLRTQLETENKQLEDFLIK